MRDASGNVMAIYTTKRQLDEVTQEGIYVKEIPIYGSSRLGQYRPKTDTKKTALGQRIYEFSNHLGNVLVTLTDNKVPQTDGTYESVVVSASDYYPFGMAMAERTYSNSEYRYGFNGQEQSDELDQNGNSYTAEFWQYNAVIGRRWNIDPIDKPWESSYAAFADNPVYYVDIDGDNADFFQNKDGQVVWRDSEDEYILDNGERYDNIGKTHSVTYNEKSEPYTIRSIEEVNEDGSKRVDNYFFEGFGLVPKEGDKVLPNATLYEKIFGRESYFFHTVGNDGRLGGLTPITGTAPSPGRAGKGMLKFFKNIKNFNKWGKGLGKLFSKTKQLHTVNNATNYKNLFTAENEFDAVKVLYRGLTGSEKSSSIIFLTDDAEVAATYVKNGMKVMKYQITERGAKTLELSQQLTIGPGKHLKGGKTSQEYAFYGKKLVEALNAIAEPLK